MNNRMNRFTERDRWPVWLLAGVVSLALTSASFADVDDPNESTVEDTRISRLREDIVIMSEVIERVLQRRLPGHFEPANLFREGVQGWYVEDMGAFFSCEVGFGVVEPTEESDSKRNGDEMDLWDEVRSSGDEGGKRDNRMPSWNYSRSRYGDYVGVGKDDARNRRLRIEDLDNAVVEAIHTYGPRIRDLKKGEEIVVTVFGKGGGSLHALPTYRTSEGVSSGGIGVLGFSRSRNGEYGLFTPRTAPAASDSSSRPEGERVLKIEKKLDELSKSIKGEQHPLDGEELAEEIEMLRETIAEDEIHAEEERGTYLGILSNSVGRSEPKVVHRRYLGEPEGRTVRTYRAKRSGLEPDGDTQSRKSKTTISAY